MNLDWLHEIYQKLPFQLLDYGVIGLNLLIFLYAGFVIRESQKEKVTGSTRNRMLALRATNLALFFIYVITGIIETIFNSQVPHLKEISQTGLTILISYIAFHYVQNWIVIRFGKEKDVNGEKFKGESYASEIVGLIALVLVASIVFLIIINVWELNNWLQATSVIGGILILLFASKDYFLGDMISGLIMHYNHSVEAGSVIRVKELDITGVVMQITLSQTTIRDMVQKHEIAIPNSKLRNATVETISNSTKNGFRDFLDFKIGYEHQTETILSFLTSIWQQSTEIEAAINAEAPPKIIVVDNGDHAVTWRLLYYVKNPYRLSDARNTIQTQALEYSQKQAIGLNTPMTHQILGQ